MDVSTAVDPGSPIGGPAHFPVVILGAGPTGLMLANLLGLQGIRTLVVEREADTVGEARAVSIDDESLRTVQAAGLIDQVLPDVVQGYGVDYYSWRGKRFSRIAPNRKEYGFQKRNAFRQPLLVAQLRDGIRRFEASAIVFGHELLHFEDHGDSVELALSQAGVRSSVRCSWLVACDGARSSVRARLGIPLLGGSYGEKWLIADLIGRSGAFRHTRTYCDPARPAIRLPGPHATLRYEFMLHAGEDPEQLLDEARLRSLIRERDPADAELRIARKLVYTFHARVAERWKAGRIILAGDAAHLTPPFAGQGMNSGVRDAANLAWKLAGVVQGNWSTSMLETYEQERKPHAWSLIRMALRIGAFMQPKSVWAAMLAQGALKLMSLYPPVRDYFLQLKFKPKPRFLAGFFCRGLYRTAMVPAGQLWPQPVVELAGGGSVLLDDLLGPGFALLAMAQSAKSADVQAARDWLSSCGLVCRSLAIVAQDDDFLMPQSELHWPDGGLRDSEGQLELLLRSAGAQAVVLRPDRYVLGYIDSRDGQSLRKLQRLFELHLHRG